MSATTKELAIRAAQYAELDELNALIQLSGHALSVGFYNPEQIESINRYVFGVDTALIDDQSYLVVSRHDTTVACGGWSKRRTLYGGDQRRVGVPALLDPATEPAKIRAFFVHPQYARQGIGRFLLQHCEQAAAAHGFLSLELMATLPGVPLYQACGYHAQETVVDHLPDGVDVSFIRMTKAIKA